MTRSEYSTPRMRARPGFSATNLALALNVATPQLLTVTGLVWLWLRASRLVPPHHPIIS